MQERNVCSDAACLQGAYIKRIRHLQKANNAAAQRDKIATTEQSITISEKVKRKDDTNSGAFKGEYILVRGEPLESVCKRFKDNLNQFRKLDLDQCNPRLSDKFPEFIRPYQWKEVPFDMALAEKAIRTTTDYSNYGSSEYPEDAEQHRKDGEERWQQWKKGSEPFRAAGAAHM
jgi:hypothetical protein